MMIATTLIKCYTDPLTAVLLDAVFPLMDPATHQNGFMSVRERGQCTMTTNNPTLGGGAAHSGTATPGSVSSTSPPASPSSLKDLALKATQIICVAYTNEFSVSNNSLVDLQIGCRHKVVSSNQDVLDRALNGSLAVVTSQSGHAVVGLLGPTIPDCKVWSDLGGGFFKYAREFTPVTNVFPIAHVLGKWQAVCDVHDVTKKPRFLFHSRFCGYGTWYVPAIHDALRHEIFPIRSLLTGTRTTFA
jgi:hypothetical protein